MRVVLLGVDGAAPSLIDRWTQQGLLPTFRHLIKTGAWGELASTVPPLTPPAWTSSVTGQNPGRHGVYDFTRRAPLSQDGSRQNGQLVGSEDRKAKAIWEWLNESGKSAGVITFPFAFPPTQVDGYMLSEIWGLENEYQMNPPHLLNELAQEVPDWFTRTRLKDFLGGDYAALEQKLIKDIKARFDVLSYLMQKKPTDLTLIVFNEIDAAQHFFWHFMDSLHPWNQATRSTPFEHTLLRCYQMIDERLGKLLDSSKIDFLIVYSDHGFGPLSHDVMIDAWLIEQGWMSLLESARKQMHRMNRMDAGALARRFGLSWLTRRIPERFKRGVTAAVDDIPGVDWARTSVYFDSVSTQSLRLNVRGREPHGIVDPGEEYVRLRTEVIEKLRSLRDERSGKPVVKDVYAREDAFSGPFIEDAPDIVVQCASGFQLQHGYKHPLVQSAQHGTWPRSGAHEPEGMALIWGEGVREDTRFHAHIMDIAPTVLEAFGIEPPEMDGKSLRELFSGTVKPPRWGASVYTPEQQEQISERLRMLGYL